MKDDLKGQKKLYTEIPFPRLTRRTRRMGLMAAASLQREIMADTRETSVQQDAEYVHGEIAETTDEAGKISRRTALSRQS